MKQLAIVTIFGMLGVLTRYGLGQWAAKAFPTSLPWFTFGINISGAFLMGVIYILGVERISMSPELRAGLTVGLLGGFTTFSAYCIESIRLWESGEPMLAVFYYFGSPALGLAACYGAVSLMRSLLN
jgi:CrcB protein